MPIPKFITDRYVDGGGGINNLDWSNIAKDLGVAGAVYGLINPNDSSGIAKFLGTGGSQQPIGYTGGIPNYTATRELAPNAFAQTYTTPTGEVAPRRPGAAGRRYFTDTTFTQDTGTPFMGITAEQIAAQNQAALDEQALFESILGGVETQRETAATTPTGGITTPTGGITTPTGGITTPTGGTRAQSTEQGAEYARRIMQEPGEYPFSVTNDANYFRPDGPCGLFDQGLTPEQLMQEGGTFEYIYPGSAGESGLRQAYQYWQQNRAGTGTTTFPSGIEGDGVTSNSVLDGFGEVVRDTTGTDNVYTAEGYKAIPYNNFVNQFMGRDLTADDAAALASSGYSLDALAKSFGVSAADLQNFVNYYTTNTGGTGGTGGTTSDSGRPTAAELKQAVLDGTMDYSTAYRQLGIADAVNPFGFTEDEQMALGIHESQRTGQGYKYNPTTGSMDLYDYDTDAFVDTTVTATPTDGPLAPSFDMVDASDGLSKQEQDIIYSVMRTSGANIADVAEEFGASQLDVIEGLLRGGYETPEQIATTLSAASDTDFSEEQLIANLLEQGKTNPEEVAAYYGIPVSAVTARYRELGGTKFAQGGNVNGYYLGGSTDGMADQIPATINNMQPAALSDGEFVIPADVVSHLGNGNSDAGAQNLYKMMERVRKDRTGNPKQGKQIDPNKYLA